MSKSVAGRKRESPVYVVTSPQAKETERQRHLKDVSSRRWTKKLLTNWHQQQKRLNQSVYHVGNRLVWTQGNMLDGV